MVAGWSERQLRALAGIFATFVAPTSIGQSRRHAELAASALNEVAEPLDLRLVKLTLTVLGQRLANERTLKGWAMSPIPRQRTFYQTVKRLALFFAYADPGPDGGNARWSEIGYEPARNAPAAAGVAVERALIGPPAAGLRLEADVVVVGSGAGGGVIASRLAAAGRDVLVIEAGPYAAEPDMPTDELSAFTRLYLDHGMTSSSDLGVAILAGAGLGGGTLVNWTTCIEPPPWVRDEWATDHGLADFSGAETDSEIARLREELGFCPPPSIGPKDQAILDGAAALGWEAAPTERNADGCADCGSCGFGCRRGAKLSGQRRHLADAAGNGARVLVDAQVERVAISGGRATGVSGVVGAKPFSVRASAVVVAAGALRTPAILLRSGLEHREIGRNLHLHPTVAVAAQMVEPVVMWRDTMQAARSTQFVRDGVLIESAPAHPGLIALAFPWDGAREMAAFMEQARYLAPFIGIVRDQGSGQVRLSRSGRARISYRLDKRDAPVARSALTNMAKLARAAGAKRMVALGTPGAWHEVGDERDWAAYLARLSTFDFGPNRATTFSAHQMGTARAGSNPRTSVADSYGRVRRDTRGALVKNLYVGDASLFPTALGVNPMVTVMTLAARVARGVAADS